MARDSTLLSKLLNLSEERFGVAVGDLLSSDRFINSVERAVSSGAAARTAIEAGMARLLRVFNVPTLDDLLKVERKLEELEELIGEAAGEVDRIEAMLRGKAKAKSKAAGGRGAGRRRSAQ